MTELRLLFRFLDKDFLFRMIFILLLYSIVLLVGIFFFLWLSEVGGDCVMSAVMDLPRAPRQAVVLSLLPAAAFSGRAFMRARSAPPRDFAATRGCLGHRFGTCRSRPR